MAVSKQAVAGGVVALGSGAAAGGIILSRSSETIEDKLGKDLLPAKDGFEKEWKSLADDLVASSSITEGSLLKEIKDQETSAETNSKGSKLKQWCQEQTEKSSSENELLSLVEKWCVYTIEKKLKETSRQLNLTDNSNETDWKERTGILKDNELESEFEVLKSTKEEITSKDTDWEKLRNWCKKEEIYSRGYKGSEDITWKLASKFCAKATILEKLNETELPTTGVEDVWTKKVNDGKGTDDTKQAKDTQLKTKLGTNNAKKDLQDWCSEQYVKAHDLKTPNDSATAQSNLLDEVKKLCTYTIKQKLDETTNKPAVLESGDDVDTSWQNNAKALNGYNKTGNEPELSEELVKIKKDTATSIENKDEVKKWCQDNWNKGYKGNNQLYKLADKFCRKNTTT